MKIRISPILYRCTSIVIAGSITAGAIFFQPGLQTFASSQIADVFPSSSQNDTGIRTASSSDADRHDDTNETAATPSNASPSDAAATSSNAVPNTAKRKTPPLSEPRFDKTEGSEDVTNLQVPTLAYDDTSITLVWDKPEKYDEVADYAVYQDGTQIGTARENFAEHADWAST